MADEHLFFDLQPRDPYSKDFLVIHSGIASAVQTIEKVIDDFVNDTSKFHFIYLWGNKGTGKTHIINAYVSGLKERLAKELSDKVNTFRINDSADIDNEQSEFNTHFVPKFVSTYEKTRLNGGVIFIEAGKAAKNLSANPHLSSRLLACNLLEVTYPRENELEALIQSLLERKNLKLSEHKLNYLLKRLPLDPLSFDNIFCKINEICLSRGVSAKQSIIRESIGS